ncbi:carbohydrate sulfotransferase 11-like [Penaeus chinensis]|uniref:carbohydrate sulfotransferase 11-like n=1 Tax=Penaeus chinensis TaxID=139456 RepID=UPI001FB76281|nr:carbohydrate sulfotransferase 11-like [Penaeus chinensis]
MLNSKVLSVIVFVGLVFTLNFLYQNGHANSSLRDETFERQGVIEERFRSRRERVLKTCRTAQNMEDVVCTLNTRVLYFWNYNASICTMGKVSSGTWRSHAQRVNNVRGHPMYDGRRRSLLRKPWQQIIDYSKSVSRWITVRHPLTRLVSCYQDKYRNGSNFPERKINVLGEFLFPALISNGLVFKSQNSYAWKNFLDKRKRSVKMLNAIDKRGRSSVTFTEFLNHVAHTFEEGRINRHWKTYGLLCSPCFFDYEYIAKTETQDQDLEYLFNRFGFPSDPHQAVKVKEDVRRKTENDLRYYETVPMELKQKIYNIYKTDMEMFGYDLPQDFWKTP